MKKLNRLGNIEIDEKQGYAFFSINPKIFPLDMIYSAAYIMIDRAFIILDGDPEKEIRVEIRKKNEKIPLKELVMLFNEELLNYATYKLQSEKTKNIKEMIMQRVLLTNSPQYFVNPKENEIKEKIKKSKNKIPTQNHG